MYAVIKAGGKQLRVEAGQTVEIDLLNAPVGETLALNDVLLVGGGEGESKVGTPLVSGMVVNAKVLAHGRGRKQVGMRYKPKKRYRVVKGSRPYITRLLIMDIAPSA